MKLKDNRVTITKIDPNYKEIRKLDTHGGKEATGNA